MKIFCWPVSIVTSTAGALTNPHRYLRNSLTNTAIVKVADSFLLHLCACVWLFPFLSLPRGRTVWLHLTETQKCLEEGAQCTHAPLGVDVLLFSVGALEGAWCGDYEVEL